MKKVLVIGGYGMLGFDVVKTLEKVRYIKVYAPTHNDIDITKKDCIEKICKLNPDYIINCAAYTNVDDCEVNTEKAYEINGYAVKNIAEAANKCGAVLVHISTDYVFDGSLYPKESYAENMKPSPRLVYGKSKLIGERSAMKADKYYVLRTAWLYGINGNNFVKTMIELSKTKKELYVVNDQHGTPTSTRTLAKIIQYMITTSPPYGTYNATNDGFTTWHGFAKKIFEILGKDVVVNAVTTAEYNALTNKNVWRPSNSKLSKDKLRSLGIVSSLWYNELDRYLNKNYKNLKSNKFII